VAIAATACGMKGPPLAPFPRVPGQADGVTAERVGDEVVVSFTVPSSNVDRRAPADLDRLEVFAISSLRPPETEAHRKLATLLATLPVRPVLPPEVAAAAAAAGAPPLPPGYDQGGEATYEEPLTPESQMLVELPLPKGVVPRPVVEYDGPLIAPLVAPAPIDAGRRYYYVVGVSPRGRRGQPSGVVSVPFGETSGPPSAPLVTYTATEMAVTWAPPTNARTSTLPAVRPPKPPKPPDPATVAAPATAAADATSSAATAASRPAPPAAGVAPAPAPDAPKATPDAPKATPAPVPTAPVPTPAQGAPVSARTTTAPRRPVSTVPVPPPLLSARSRGFNVQGTTYHLYEVAPPKGTEIPPEGGEIPPDPTLPKRHSPQPLVDPEYTIKGIEFGVERCFMVRAVDQVAGTAVQGPASPTTCVTPIDTFAPAPPQSLAAIGGQGVINLIWERGAEADLAGYVVLRGEAPGGTLQPLMPTPIQDTTFADRTARPGVRYVYAVVAVDTAPVPNMSAPSNRDEEATRQ